MMRTLAHHAVNLLNYANRLWVADIAAVVVVVRFRRVEDAAVCAVVTTGLLTRPKPETGRSKS